MASRHYLVKLSTAWAEKGEAWGVKAGSPVPASFPVAPLVLENHSGTNSEPGVLWKDW